MSRLLDAAQAAIQAHRLLAKGGRIVVAVSGGPDSVALLHALVRLQPAWRLKLHVAHLNHGLRPEAGQDAAFVRDLAGRWRLPVTIRELDVAADCRRHGWSLEDGARRLRYDFLAAVARQHSATEVALAHTADDQAETVLMRLMRGTGLLGLSAIPRRRPFEIESPGEGHASQPDCWIIRPLLEVWRDEVLAHLREARLACREDATNRDERFLRNRIRHHLLPLLQREYSPNIKGLLTHLAEQSRSDYRFLEDAADRQWKRVAAAHAPDAVSLSIARFRRQPKAVQRQLVRRAVERVRGDAGQLEFRHWVEIERVFEERPLGAVVDLPGGVQVTRGRDRVTCHRAPPRNGGPSARAT